MCMGLGWPARNKKQAICKMIRCCSVIISTYTQTCAALLLLTGTPAFLQADAAAGVAGQGSHNPVVVLAAQLFALVQDLLLHALAEAAQELQQARQLQQQGVLLACP
jgi:hypothetical protein